MILSFPVGPTWHGYIRLILHWSCLETSVRRSNRFPFRILPSKRSYQLFLQWLRFCIRLNTCVVSSNLPDLAQFIIISLIWEGSRPHVITTYLPCVSGLLALILVLAWLNEMPNQHRSRNNAIRRRPTHQAALTNFTTLENVYSLWKFGLGQTAFGMAFL